jgi:hypothetical protein
MKARIREPLVRNGEKRALNRQEKRDISRRYNIPMEQLERLFKDATISYNYETFTEGSKVKLDYERIMEKTDDKSEKYLEFVEQHKDDVMTIQYDENHKNNPSVFCLAEDDGPVKWLFSIHDLILVEMAGVSTEDQNADKEIESGIDEKVEPETDAE